MKTVKDRFSFPGSSAELDCRICYHVICSAKQLLDPKEQKRHENKTFIYSAFDRID